MTTDISNISRGDRVYSCFCSFNDLFLRDCLKSPKFYALSKAFRALITLGDREAIPLAIARITNELSKSERGRLVKELQRVTGQPYGHYQIWWNLWWRFFGGQWQISATFRKSWDEQKRDSAPISISPFVAFMLTFFLLADNLIHRCKYSRAISSITNTNFFKS